MILAEVSHPPTKFIRLETFKARGEANKWIDFVIKTDIAIQSYRNNCVVKIVDIPTGSCLVESSYIWWR